MKFDLSICIPTCNRAQFLAKTLDSIVGQAGFHDAAIEVVVCDNCSEDDTAQIALRYVDRFGSCVRYHRQPQRVGVSQNMGDALYLAQGAYAKLNNDTLAWRPGALATVLKKVRERLHHSDKMVLWFSNGTCEACVCRSLDQFVQSASFLSTWIGSFGAWREDLELVHEVFTNDVTQLPQSVTLCRLLVGHRMVEIVAGCLFLPSCPRRKGGYNIAEVFGHNYLEILLAQVSAGHLSFQSYAREKRRVLLRHINGFYFDFRNQYAFEKTGYFRWLWPYYRLNAYFYLALAALPFSWLGAKRKMLSKRFRAVLKWVKRSSPSKLRN